MLLFKVASIIPRKQRTFIVAITSQDKILDILISGSTHQGTELAAFQQYRVFYLDVSSGKVSSISFFSSDLPHESLTLPLYKDIEKDFYCSENEEKAEESLNIAISICHKINPFNEEDLRYSMDNQYQIDDEPLIDINDTEFNTERENMVNSLIAAQAKHYKILFEHEKELRKKIESIAEEMNKKFDEKMKEFQNRELSIQIILEEKEILIQKTENEANEVKRLNERLKIQKTQTEEKFEVLQIQLDSFKKMDFHKEINAYQELIDSMEKKWNSFADKLENNHDTDPIHFLIKEKDDKIVELVGKLNSKSLAENEIENEMIKRNLVFYKENELVYSVENTKIVVFYENNTLWFRKLGELKPIDEFYAPCPQKRANSAFRVEVSKSLSLKKPSKLQNGPLPGRSPGKQH